MGGGPRREWWSFGPTRCRRPDQCTCPSAAMSVGCEQLEVRRIVLSWRELTAGYLEVPRRFHSHWEQPAINDRLTQGTEGPAQSPRGRRTCSGLPVRSGGGWTPAEPTPLPCSPSRGVAPQKPLARGSPSHSASRDPHLHWLPAWNSLALGPPPRSCLCGAASERDHLVTLGGRRGPASWGLPNPNSRPHLFPILPMSAVGPPAAHPLHVIPASSQISL